MEEHSEMSLCFAIIKNDVFSCIISNKYSHVKIRNIFLNYVAESLCIKMHGTKEASAVAVFRIEVESIVGVIDQTTYKAKYDSRMVGKPRFP